MELKMIKLSDIETNPLQPRQEFDRDKLNELANSIKEGELLQPIVVRPNNGGKTFEIVAGERRFKAFQILKEKKIPAIVRNIKDDTDALEKSLIENWQREDLTDGERMNALNHLWESKRYKSIREMERKTGIPHQEISGYIRAKEEREIVEKDFQNKLTYVDFHETRPLKDSPEVRKKILEKRAKGEIESKQLRDISKKVAEFPEPEQQLEILEEFEEQEDMSREIFDDIVRKKKEIVDGLREPEHIIEDDPDELRLNSLKNKYENIFWLTPANINIIKSEKFRGEAIDYLKKMRNHLNKLLQNLGEEEVLDIDKEN